MRRFPIATGLACWLCWFGLSCSTSSPKQDMTHAPFLPAGTELIVGFYNVENLFDTIDDPYPGDDEFTPHGRYKWTEEKYAQKIANIAKAIHSIGKGGPDLLGLGEVENRYVISDLIHHPLLKERQYQIVHDESPDNRGIDVGFIYDPTKFSYFDYEAFRIEVPSEPRFKTREVLRITGSINDENLYLLVNHWPSRREGRAETEPRRMAAAELNRRIYQDIVDQEPDPCVIVMGDFNDDPFNQSIYETLQAKARQSQVGDNELFNPMAALLKPRSRGSLTYEGAWNLFDQIIVSEDLMSGSRTLSYQSGSATVHNPDFLQVGFGKGKNNPRRAVFRGKFEKEGFSDHFPVYLRLVVQNNQAEQTP